MSVAASMAALVLLGAAAFVCAFSYGGGTLGFVVLPVVLFVQYAVTRTCLAQCRGD